MDNDRPAFRDTDPEVFGGLTQASFAALALSTAPLRRRAGIGVSERTLQSLYKRGFLDRDTVVLAITERGKKALASAWDAYDNFHRNAATVDGDDLLSDLIGRDAWIKAALADARSRP